MTDLDGTYSCANLLFRITVRIHSVRIEWLHLSDANRVVPYKFQLCLLEVPEQVRYIPPRQTKKTGRTRRIERLFNEGLSVAEIASHIKLSERQVYRLKKAWSENAWRREMEETVQQSQCENPIRDELLEPRATAKLCRGCGRPVVGQRANYCDLCRTIEGGSDGEVIVVTNLPFATFDPRF